MVCPVCDAGDNEACNLLPVRCMLQNGPRRHNMCVRWWHRTHQHARACTPHCSGGVGGFGVGIGLLSLRRRSKVRSLCSEAAQAVEQGDHEEARLAAERSWSFNAHNGSRSSHLADLDTLTQILGLLARVSSPARASSCITRVESTVAELRALFSDRANFGVDGRSMKREAAVRWSELSDRFQTLRQELRESYETKTSAA
jgi:hypothetical protein